MFLTWGGGGVTYGKFCFVIPTHFFMSAIKVPIEILIILIATEDIVYSMMEI
jgi:hypothetical protein